MSNESNFLSHHERKRLEYLYSNFHYLNEREQLEYNYLLKKSQGAYEEAEALQPEVDATEEVQGEIAEPIEKDPRQTDSQVACSLFLAHYRWHGLHVCERPEQQADRSRCQTGCR